MRTPEEIGRKARDDFYNSRYASTDLLLDVATNAARLAQQECAQEVERLREDGKILAQSVTELENIRAKLLTQLSMLIASMCGMFFSMMFIGHIITGGP